ncbi:MAG: tetratricopeptide repeat protein [Oceanicaulis sp.]
MITVVLICAAAGMAGALYVARPFSQGGARSARLAGVACAGLIAIGALGAYLVNGEPAAPGSPYVEMAERLRSADPQTLSAIEQEEVLRAAIRDNPRDVEALALLGRYLARTDRELEGVVLLERAISIDGRNPRLWASLGEALVTLNGEVTDQARRAFARANTLDPTLPEPAFFLGVAAYEAGDRNAAAQAWADILARLDPDDPFREAIAGRAADLLSRPQSGPGSDGAAPFAEAAREGADMDAMVSAMVDGLETRLSADPDDLSGWLTLARARMMQNSPDQARAALQRARAEFAAEPGKLALIAAIERALPQQETDA